MARGGNRTADTRIFSSDPPLHARPTWTTGGHDSEGYDRGLLSQVPASHPGFGHNSGTPIDGGELEGPACGEPACAVNPLCLPLWLGKRRRTPLLFDGVEPVGKPRYRSFAARPLSVGCGASPARKEGALWCEAVGRRKSIDPSASLYNLGQRTSNSLRDQGSARCARYRLE